MKRRRQATGVSTLEQLEALVDNPAVYALAELIPDQEPAVGGRPRHYPAYAVILWLALITVYRSSRRVETELSHPDTWGHLRRLVERRFPDQPEMWLPEKPMRSHNYRYFRDRYLEPRRGGMKEVFREFAARQAQELGLCREDGRGSLTHPSLSRMPYADGKVVTPLYKAKRGKKRVDPVTGETRRVRADPDAQLHVTGGGFPAYGNKFVLVACRGTAPHARVVLDVEHVASTGAEAAVAIECFRRVRPFLPGAQGVLYDGAFRGVHLQELLHDLGLLPVVPVTPATGGHTTGEPAVHRTVRVGEVDVTGEDEVVRTHQLYSQAGTLGLGELNESGDVVFVPLVRRKVVQRRNADKTWRWYGEYALPAEAGGGEVRVRLDATDHDREVGFNRTEHVRPIPPGDADYAHLYPRRNDIESINRTVDDSMWLGRAHSVGAARQELDMIGFALAKNSVALHRHRRTSAPPGHAAA